MEKEKKYKANVREFEKILKAMPFKKSDFDKNIKVRGCANRVFSYLSLGKKDYPIEIFEKLAIEFTKEYKKMDQKTIVKTKDLIDPKNKDEGLKNWLLTDEYSCNLEIVNSATILTKSINNPNTKRVFINHTRTNKAIVNQIELIFSALDSNFFSENHEHYWEKNSTKARDQIKDLKIEAQINEAIDNLSKHFHVNIYVGDLWLHLLGFDLINPGDQEQSTFQSSLNMVPHQIFLISYVLENDPKLIYETNFPFLNVLEAANFISETPCKVFEDQSTGSLTEKDILLKMQEFYWKKHNKFIFFDIRKDSISFKNLKLFDYEKAEVEAEMDELKKYNY
jgi:hypothetical protein